MFHIFLLSGFLFLQSAEPAPVAGEIFRDCENCPEMVVVPPGDFMMGSHIDLPNRKYEIPLHKVTIPKAFAVGKFEVTFDEWDLCVADGGCKYSPKHFRAGAEGQPGWERGSRPVFRVSWYNIQTYIKWLSAKTGQKYRLLTEAEWEYMARAGTTSIYSTGDSITSDQANFLGKNAPRYSNHKQTLTPRFSVGSFPPNAFGIHDVHGSEWEWVQDCWHETYSGAPTDGSAWVTPKDCERRVIRGGSWNNKYRNMRSSIRSGYKPHRQSVSFGFRLARDLEENSEQ